jgi:hypothetical protein
VKSTEFLGESTRRFQVDIEDATDTFRDAIERGKTRLRIHRSCFAFCFFDMPGQSPAEVKNPFLKYGFVPQGFGVKREDVKASASPVPVVKNEPLSSGTRQGRGIASAVKNEPDVQDELRISQDFVDETASGIKHKGSYGATVNPEPVVKHEPEVQDDVQNGQDVINAPVPSISGRHGGIYQHSVVPEPLSKMEPAYNNFRDYPEDWDMTDSEDSVTDSEDKYVLPDYPSNFSPKPLFNHSAPPIHQNTAPPIYQNTAPPIHHPAPPIHHLAPPVHQNVASPIYQNTAPLIHQNVAFIQRNRVTVSAELYAAELQIQRLKSAHGQAVRAMKDAISRVNESQQKINAEEKKRVKLMRELGIADVKRELKEEVKEDQKIREEAARLRQNESQRQRRTDANRRHRHRRARTKAMQAQAMQAQMKTEAPPMSNGNQFIKQEMDLNNGVGHAHIKMERF